MSLRFKTTHCTSKKINEALPNSVVKIIFEMIRKYAQNNKICSNVQHLKVYSDKVLENILVIELNQYLPTKINLMRVVYCTHKLEEQHFIAFDDGKRATLMLEEEFRKLDTSKPYYDKIGE
ncbi:MAG: DUF960 family protein [Vallitaleaceae bacterium]|nr:DUF960 family protein [Vallitaleaceae bacterium]